MTAMRFALVLVAGCGRVPGQELPDAASPEIAVDAAPDSPSDSPAAPCDLTKPFASPVPVDGVNTPSNDSGLHLTADELTGYLFSDRPPTPDVDIWKVTRSRIDEPFSNATNGGDLAAVNTTTHGEYDPAISADGLALYFARIDGSEDIYFATRSATDLPFSAPVAVTIANTTTDELQPWITFDGNELWFGSARTGKQDIYRSVRVGGVFGPPSQVLELESPANDFGAVLTRDGLTVYFSSDRAEMWHFQIYAATRSSTSDGFGAPYLVGELASPTAKVEWPSWVSLDGCRLYLSSDRSGTDQNIYVASRPAI